MRVTLLSVLIPLIVISGAGVAQTPLFEYAQDHVDELQLCGYMTAGHVRTLAADPEQCHKAAQVFYSLGVTKVFLEVYRGGTVLEEAELIRVRDFFQANAIAVAGGIATVPGKDFGVEADVGLHWFNFQNPKTQNDLLEVMKVSARVFDEFIVDDFLCSGDRSAESAAAKGDRSWGDYRRDLTTSVSQKIFLAPVREINPDITMIVKFPQWYDRFHLFGYDVERFPQMYDRVWVGTETRGDYTQRYGFVQPYEGFVNYSWLKTISGDKIAGAWFDHGDCGPGDFIDQAWQSVLAGAREIMLFEYGSLLKGHEDHDQLRRDFPHLVTLANAIRKTPVHGVTAYKPPHSDAGGDLYLMDFIGMLGIPLVPVPALTGDETALFLPTQAAKDPDLFEKISAMEHVKVITVTTGFLANAADQLEWAVLAGVEIPVLEETLRAAYVRNIDTTKKVVFGWDEKVEVDPELLIAANLKPTTAKVLLEAYVEKELVPFVTVQDGPVKVIVLNSHTYSDEDFKAVGEVLLAPRPLGLLELPQSWVDTLRRTVAPPWTYSTSKPTSIHAPARVTVQPFGEGWMVQNYHGGEETVSLTFSGGVSLVDGFTGAPIMQGSSYQKDLQPGERLWLMHTR